MSCGVGRRCGSDPVLMWLWPRSVATAPIGPLTWEPPYAQGVGLKRHTHTHTHTHKEEVAIGFLVFLYLVVPNFPQQQLFLVPYTFFILLLGEVFI